MPPYYFFDEVNEPDYEGYDVFMSCKSEDYDRATPVYHWLVEKGYRPFFAPVSLKVSKAPGEPVVFGDEIDDAIEESNNMIVVASNAEYVKTGYVKDEWRTFVEEQRAGRKKGVLITILDGVDVADLPLRLRSVQSFTLGNYKEGIIRFLGEPFMQSKSKYYYVRNGLNDLTEPSRHAVYNYYFPKEDALNESTDLFFGKTKECLNEMYAFHEYLNYEPDKGREDYLLAEWIIKNNRIKESILHSLVQKYGESITASLAHSIYDNRKKIVGK